MAMTVTGARCNLQSSLPRLQRPYSCPPVSQQQRPLAPPSPLSWEEHRKVAAVVVPREQTIGTSPFLKNLQQQQARRSKGRVQQAVICGTRLSLSLRRRQGRRMFRRKTGPCSGLWTACQILHTC